MNLGLLLKMLGVKVTPEQIAAIEAIIPQIPGKIQQTINVVNAALQNFDERLRVLEDRQLKHREWLESRLLLLEFRILEEYARRNDGDNGSDIRPAGIGATQRTIERTGIDG